MRALPVPLHRHVAPSLLRKRPVSACALSLQARFRAHAHRLLARAPCELRRALAAAPAPSQHPGAQACRRCGRALPTRARRLRKRL
eukprot:622083-Pleurochrysis_carterae.AAC.1